MIHVFLTPDHPQAGGREPQDGDREYIVRFPVEGGDQVAIRMGQLGYEIHSQQLLDMMAETPSYNDGSMDQPPG